MVWKFSDKITLPGALCDAGYGNPMLSNTSNGKLLFCSSDLSRKLDSRPVARQLRYSLLKYMETNEFNPKDNFSFESIKKNLYNIKRTKENRKFIYENFSS